MSSNDDQWKAAAIRLFYPLHFRYLHQYWRHTKNKEHMVLLWSTSRAPAKLYKSVIADATHTLVTSAGSPLGLGFDAACGAHMRFAQALSTTPHQHQAATAHQQPPQMHGRQPSQRMQTRSLPGSLTSQRPDSIHAAQSAGQIMVNTATDQNCRENASTT